jgi:hypothetical protein
MATAEELLGTISEGADEILVVDLNTRIISIPATLKVLGVESDDDVKRLQFKVPRYCGEFDLSTFEVRINFQNARGGGDLYPVDDLNVTDDKFITFSWLVNRTAFAAAGDVKFNICMKLFDDEGVVVKEFNTTPATLPVLKGLETEAAVVDNNPSAFDIVLHRLYAVEAATGNSQNGYYTIATVNETDEGVEIEVVGSDGTHVATVKNGLDGYNPVKGTDYWTEEDKVEMQTMAREYVNRWSPKSIPVTLAASSWNPVNNTIKVAVDNVTPDNIVVIAASPADNNRILYGTHGVRCIAQGEDYLGFECQTVPTSDIVVNVGVFYVA